MPTAKQLFKLPAEWKGATETLERLLPPTLPEVAFVGRSNVGKSSLLNAILKRKQLARTSKTPGCTQALHFYQIGEHVRIIDVPGYGYAKASRKEVSGWTQLIKDYIYGRTVLKRVFLLVDGRHGLKDTDREMMTFLDNAAVNYQIILTKIDKQSQKGLNKIKQDIEALADAHAALHPDILALSSHKATGLDDLRLVIANLVG